MDLISGTSHQDMVVQTICESSQPTPCVCFQASTEPWQLWTISQNAGAPYVSGLNPARSDEEVQLQGDAGRPAGLDAGPSPAPAAVS